MLDGEGPAVCSRDRPLAEPLPCCEPVPGLGNALPARADPARSGHDPAPSVGQDGCARLKPSRAGGREPGRLQSCACTCTLVPFASLLWSRGTGLGRVTARLQGQRVGKAALRVLLWPQRLKRIIWGTSLVVTFSVACSLSALMGVQEQWVLGCSPRAGGVGCLGGGACLPRCSLESVAALG